jgi:Mg-chelatase subunit ChlD
MQARVLKPEEYYIEEEPYYAASHNEIVIFEAAWKNQLPILLKGPTGCGKTRFMEYMAWRLKLPLITVSCHDDLTASDLVGRFLITGGETVWVDGPLTRAVRHGALCYLDEIVEARKDTTVVIHPLTDDRRVLPIEKLGGIVKALSQFCLLKRQLDGDEIDIDALIETLADAASGLEMSQHVFTRIHKVERDVVVIFLVDMSGSTKGWINQAERESLILLCEAVETLGDRYGIYGFSGMTRTRCEIYPIKTLEEIYDDTVRERICAIKAKDYTRMGAAIRYTNKLLSEVEAKTRLLVTLSDGKPDDFDNYYRGQYGIEDTRQALIESKRQGIHPFCITLDKEGPDYLPHLYGPVNYTVVDQVYKLPLKVADIYRVLTTR